MLAPLSPAVQALGLVRGLGRRGLGRRVVLCEPAGRIVLRIEADLAFPLPQFLRAALTGPALQALTSSVSFWDSCMTFCATCEGISS